MLSILSVGLETGLEPLPSPPEARPIRQSATVFQCGYRHRAGSIVKSAGLALARDRLFFAQQIHGVHKPGWRINPLF